MRRRETRCWNSGCAGRRGRMPHHGARAAIIGGCTSTSNVLTAQMFGDGCGTHAHSWVMSFPDELSAFRAYADTFPSGCMLLVDTYDTLKSDPECYYSL